MKDMTDKDSQCVVSSSVLCMHVCEWVFMCVGPSLTATFASDATPFLKEELAPQVFLARSVFPSFPVAPGVLVSSCCPPNRNTAVQTMAKLQGFFPENASATSQLAVCSLKLSPEQEERSPSLDLLLRFQRLLFGQLYPPIGEPTDGPSANIGWYLLAFRPAWALALICDAAQCTEHFLCVAAYGMLHVCVAQGLRKAVNDCSFILKEPDYVFERLDRFFALFSEILVSDLQWLYYIICQRFSSQTFALEYFSSG